MQNNQTIEAPSERVISRGGLYSPQPIPAQIVLSRAKEFAAQRVLLALTSYLGDKTNNYVYPTYEQLKVRCGARPSTISKALDTLVDYGFISIFRYWENGKKHNKYYFKGACWHFRMMSEVARNALPRIGECFCGKIIKEGDLAFGVTDYHHVGCGDIVTIDSTAIGYKKRLAKLRALAMESAREIETNGEEMD